MIVIISISNILFWTDIVNSIVQEDIEKRGEARRVPLG